MLGYATCRRGGVWIGNVALWNSEVWLGTVMEK